MEKDALLEIIIHDLKEVELMAENAKGDKPLSKAYFKLTRNRINSILDEIEMLEELSLPGSQVSEIVDITEKPESEEAIQVTAKKEEEKDKQPAVTHEEPEPKDSSEKETTEEEKVSTPEEPTPDEEPPHETSISDISDDNTPIKEETTNPISEPVEKAHPEKKKENQVLGEKLIPGKSSFNEQIGKNQKSSSSNRSFSAPPIADLKKAMGINDRFFFQRELFGGSADVMNQTLEQLNEMQGVNEAQNFLLANFNWDPENEAVLSFMELVERRYLS
jgi:chemotaxis protein histidine kinase CheA